MLPDQLFLRVLDDLRAKTTTPHDEYELLRAAGLLRLLLLDGNRLADVVNRRYRLAVRYVVLHKTPLTARVEGGSSVLQMGIAPDLQTYPGQATREVTRDQLLKVEAMQASTEGDHFRFTVLDVISFTCNVLGGVHYGEPVDAADHRLMEVVNWNRDIREWLPDYDDHDIDRVRRTLVQVATVVLAGLQPLADTVRGTQADGDDPRVPT